MLSLFLLMVFLGYRLDVKLFNVPMIPANFDDELDELMKNNE